MSTPSAFVSLFSLFLAINMASLLEITEIRKVQSGLVKFVEQHD